MENNDKVPFFILKLNLAGSGQAILRKATESGKIDKINALRNYKDIYYKTRFVCETNKNELAFDISSVFENDELKKGDLFYELKTKNYGKKYENLEVPKLTLYRPGVGANGESPEKTERGYIDMGQYNTERSIALCEKILKSIVEEVSRNVGEIFLRIKGHSRGAVAASHIRKKFEKFKPGGGAKLHVSGIFLDPVPGPSFLSKDIELTEKDDKGKNALIFSVNAHREIGFSPQEIKGADVIIFTSLGHSVGNQNIYYDEANKKYSKPKWKYNNEIYNYGRIDELPDGVYYQSNKTILEKEEENKDVKKHNDDIYLEPKWHNAANERLLITLNKIDGKNLIGSLNDMAEKLNLKEILELESVREEAMLNLINEKFPQDNNQEISYNRDNGFEVNKKKEKTFFEKVKLYFKKSLGL